MTRNELIKDSVEIEAFNEPHNKPDLQKTDKET